MKNIHPTQQKLLELLKEKLDKSWTIRELQEELNISSTSVVHHHLQQLEKKGYIKRNPMNPSDYQILSDNDKKITYLNLYGMAQCGPDGMILSGDPIDRIPISNKILNFHSSLAFLVQARGDSMEPKIFDGDMVIAEKSNQADNGTIVVCSNNGIALIKKIYIENGNILLHSFNPEYKPIIADENSFVVEGIVKSILTYSTRDLD